MTLRAPELRDHAGQQWDDVENEAFAALLQAAAHAPCRRRHHPVGQITVAEVLSASTWTSQALR